ncbi:KGGVGR-motif variant AAA ATPase [Rhizobium mongolense]|nr:TIR domain-containing protein [Rhizobium mongolense]
MAGTVVTFYSYKGGVGRSFALANVATLLGRWGFRVLCIDWDLEAPGLEDFFRPYLAPEVNPRDGGMVELLTEFAKTRTVPLEWRQLVQRLRKPELAGVEFIKAGHADANYMRRVQKLDWEKLYKQGLGDALETMFDELRSEYDFVLIDARTGVTDFSGIVTAQLPDILAFLFTANEQSLGGATMVANRAAKIRNDLAIDRSRLLLLPIPARFESQVEYDLSSKWRTRFVSTLKAFYEGWANKDAPVEKLVQATTIPYVPFWSFGERISAVEDRSFDTSSINYSMETIAALLAHRLGQTRLLVESRDEYVGAAQRLGRPSENSVFISYSTENRDAARQITNSLMRRGVSVLLEDLRQPGELEIDIAGRAMETATHFVLLFGRSDRDNKFMSDDARLFMRQAASDEVERQFIPFVLPNAVPQELPSFVRQYRYGILHDPETAADLIWERIRPPAAAVPDNSQLSLRVTSDGDIPVVRAQVCALADNGTVIESTTDTDGNATLKLVTGTSYQILVAHPEFSSKIIKDFTPGKQVNVRLRRDRRRGSLIIQSTGYIPDLNGRLNPIRDTSNRTYIYADNIAVDDGKPQPVQFQLDRPFNLEDSAGETFSVIVRLIEGRTTLLDYEKASIEVR